MVIFHCKMLVYQRVTLKVWALASHFGLAADLLVAASLPSNISADHFGIGYSTVGSTTMSWDIPCDSLRVRHGKRPIEI